MKDFVETIQMILNGQVTVSEGLLKMSKIAEEIENKPFEEEKELWVRTQKMIVAIQTHFNL